MTSEWLVSSIRIKILIFLITVILITLMLPKGESIEFEVTVGSVWLQSDLNAEFNFEVLKDNVEYKREIKSKINQVLPIYLFDESAEAKSKDSLERFHPKFVESIQKILDAKIPQSDRISAFSNSSIDYACTLLKKEKNSHLNYQSLLKEIKNAALSKLTALYAQGVIDSLSTLKKDSISYHKKNMETALPLQNFKTLKEIRDQLAKGTNSSFTPYDKLVYEYALQLLIPNVTYQSKLTNEEIAAAQKRVSKYAGIVNEGEHIVSKHDRITPDIKLMIDSYRLKKGEKMEKINLILQMMGKFLHILSLLSLFGIYLFLFRKKIFANNLTLGLFALVLLWVSIVAYLLNIVQVSSASKFFIFLPAASMLVTIIFDSRVGFYTTVIFSLILGAVTGNNYPFVVMNIVAGAFSVYTVRDIKNRTQIFRSFLYILVGYSITIIAFGLERFATFDTVMVELGVASINSLVSPILTYGLLIFFERIFKITTELTLLELSNFENPLLRELSNKAPGTFNHSVSISSLAEKAALTIDANSLLARVGSYYHDAGKLITPKFFVENQVDAQNIHDELKPLESVKALKEHVQRGIELAETHNLPKEIIDFIPMHHGTTLITYFYEKAKLLYGEENINANDYRYPGPKPSTKETAIVMLADSCESAVKSVTDPDPHKLENLISNLIDSRIEDGQLDECPLTFSDIMKIKAVFIESLVGQRYRRIRYPKQETMEEKDD